MSPVVQAFSCARIATCLSRFFACRKDVTISFSVMCILPRPLYSPALQ